METNPVNRKAIVLLMIVFALGAAFGVVGTRLFGARTFAALPSAGQNTAAPTTADLVARFTQELDLTPDQQKQVAAILTDMQARYGDVRQQMNPEFEQIRNQGHDQIRQILTAEQRPKFEVFLQKLHQEHLARDAQNNKR